MSIRLDKKWVSRTKLDVVAQEGNLGVYQLADASQQILFIGYAAR